MIVRHDHVDGACLQVGDVALHLGSANSARLQEYLALAAPHLDDGDRLVRAMARRITEDEFAGEPTVVIVRLRDHGTSVFAHGRVVVDAVGSGERTQISAVEATTWTEHEVGHPVDEIVVRRFTDDPSTSDATGATRMFVLDDPFDDTPEVDLESLADDALTIRRAAPAPQADLPTPRPTPTFREPAVVEDRTVARSAERTPPSVVPVPPDRRPEQVTPPGQVRGLACPQGHPNKSTDALCRTCGDVIADDLGLVVGPRPSLGWLLLDDGRRIELTHPCLVGRQPPDDHTLGGEPAMAVHVDDELHHVSQRHLEIQIVGWDVRAVDCGSTNGSRFRRAGSRRAGPLKPHVPQPLEPGDQIEVGARTITYVEQAP